MNSTSQGYDKAIELIRECATEEGFLASTTDRDNYRRIWGRDGCIIGLAALLTGDPELHDACQRTLLTLAKHQGPHGEIPSNVDPAAGRISYGGTAGRVDADLWFVICCGQYWRTSGDDEFLQSVLENLERVRFLLGAWEYNARGLIYVPLTGDWADEYVHNGYVLYDQLLYLQALREMAAVHRWLHGSQDHALEERLCRLKHLIRDNYWIDGGGGVPDDVYHEVLYEKAESVEAGSRDRYFLSFFSPAGYGYRFDAMANVLASLLDVADDRQRARIDAHIATQIVQEDLMLLPAFHPVITPKDADWGELQMTFSYQFKNQPYEYHNGGLWPLVTGFYAADLARRGTTELARKYLDGIHRANAQETDGQPWSFPEFLHGQQHTPGGTRRLGWSAAAAVIAQQAVEGNVLFSLKDGESAVSSPQA
jgi:glycogen debranching enzyme